jgi:hypothetical protein
MVVTAAVIDLMFAVAVAYCCCCFLHLLLLLLCVSFLAPPGDSMLLKGYKAKFKGAPISSTVSYLKQYVAGVLPHNPLVTHETDVRHLRDPAFLRGALRYRTARLLFTLQLRIR